jgi:hypothetical protein
MSQAVSEAPVGFVDRRQPESAVVVPPIIERRQFANSHDDLSPPAKELATAIDEYKLRHRRRFISCEELLGVIHQLGYKKS